MAVRSFFWWRLFNHPPFHFFTPSDFWFFLSNYPNGCFKYVNMQWYSAGHIKMVLQMGVWGRFGTKWAYNFFCLAPIEDTFSELFRAVGICISQASLSGVFRPFCDFKRAHSCSPNAPQRPLVRDSLPLLPLLHVLLVFSLPSAVFISPPPHFNM